MEALTLFQLRKIDEDSSVLIKDNEETLIQISGSVLEAQWRLNNGWFLLFVSENCPYEEALHCLLLDHDLSMLDELVLGQDYSSGILSDVCESGNQSITFRFDSEKELTLQISEVGFSVIDKIKTLGKRKNIFYKAHLFIQGS